MGEAVGATGVLVGVAVGLGDGITVVDGDGEGLSESEARSTRPTPASNTPVAARAMTGAWRRITDYGTTLGWPPFPTLRTRVGRSERCAPALPRAAAAAKRNTCGRARARPRRTLSRG